MVSKEVTKKLVEALEQAGYKPRAYSGRGMYDKYCLGVTTDDSPMYIAGRVMCTVLPELQPEEASTLMHAFNGHRSDSLGLSRIHYFPQIPWDEE